MTTMTPTKSSQSFGTPTLQVPGQDPFGTPSPSLAPSSPLTPSLANSVWAAQQQSFFAANSPTLKRTASQDGRVSRSGLRTPAGFEHLDFGADYFKHGRDESKRTPRSFEWETWAHDQWEQDLDPQSPTPAQQSFTLPPAPPLVTDPLVYKRRLGPNEVSYYLGSRGEGPQDPLSGVNDMYLHLAFKAPKSLVKPSRVLDIWTELRLRHTLLSSFVEFEDYEDIRFCYVPPVTFANAREEAESAFGFKYGTTKDEMLDSYLNGPRTLSDHRLAALFISTEAAEIPCSGLNLNNTSGAQDADQEQEFHFYLFATHFIGDGMALHSTANEFFKLLDGGFEAAKVAHTLQWQSNGLIPEPELVRLPPALEERLNTPTSMGRMAWAAARVEFQRNQGQLIGGHSFPRMKKGTRHTVVPTDGYSKEETSAILKTCKANGSTISHAVFALANIAHLKVTGRAQKSDPWAKDKNEKLPMMLYSALNLRGNMSKGPNQLEGTTADFFHLVIGYYNVVLPSFQPRGLSLNQTFWLRARQTKEQTVKTVKSPWLAQRSKLMFLERERRSIDFEKQDEERRRAKASSNGAGLGLGLPNTTNGQNSSSSSDINKSTATNVSAKIKAPTRSQTPSIAFLGVSMLGNLDGLYQHQSFPNIQIQGLTTGSRQRPGAMLLFAYTLCGRLYLSLGYDKNAYADGAVESFYDALHEGVREFLLPDHQRAA